jgi:hypothetical protein
VFYNLAMFFRRKPSKLITFEERIRGLTGLGFETQPMARGRVEVRRDGCAAVIELTADEAPIVDRLGVLHGGEIARLVDGGFQKFLETPSGGRRPALATQLKRLHDFKEDLDEAMGLESLYHESLGTVSDRHAYDRLTGRR